MSSSRGPPPSPTETLDLGGGLSLSPRLHLLLTFFRADLSVKPVDDWQLKVALLAFLRDNLVLSVPEDDLLLRKLPDLHKRKRDDPVVSGALFVRDLGFLEKSKYKDGKEEGKEEKGRRLAEWKEEVLRKTDGIELNLEGLKFRLEVETPAGDDFERLRKAWEDFYNWQPNRGGRRRTELPDTIIVKGVPSRWFAEPRVSSKPSMLVTHTIFSALGKIRNLNVAADDDSSKTTEAPKGDIISGLHCKIWVQFESHDDFCYALHALCGHSLQKEGSRLKADYDVTWDSAGFFRNIPQRSEVSHAKERVNQMQFSLRHHNIEGSRFQKQAAQNEYNSSRPKRFRE